jgi:hypothetical protein
MPSRLTFFYSDSDVYVSDDPVFYPAAETFPEVRHVLDHYAAIRAELASYLEGAVTVPHFNPSPPKMSRPNSWRNLYFKNYSLQYRTARKYFPRTFQVFADRPEYTLAGITTLAPGGRLSSHCGETNAIIRCHIGLKVPGTLPALGLRVNGEDVCWQEGKVLAFNDAYQHEVWNETAQPRHVLVFDIIRPEFARYRTWICAQSLGAQVLRFGLERLGLYARTPRWARALLSKPFALALWVYLLLASIPARVRRALRPRRGAPAARPAGDGERSPSRRVGA